MSNPQKIILAVLVLGTGRGPFIDCLTNLMVMTQQAGVEVFLINIRGSDIISGRTKAVRFALARYPTHLLWLDDDMYFPADTALRLLERSKEVVCCNSVMKDMTARSTASMGVNEDDRVSSAGKTGLELVTGAGLGTALTEAGVYHKIEFPWFGHRWHHAAHVKTPVIGVPNWDDWLGQFEDSWFYQRCHDAGIEVWLDHDTSQRIGHWGGITFFTEGLAAI